KTFASTILLTRCRCAGCFPSRPADAWKTALLRILSLCSGSTDCQLCGNCSDSLERWGDLGRFIAYGNAEMVLRSQIRTRRNQHRGLRADVVGKFSGRHIEVVEHERDRGSNGRADGKSSFLLAHPVLQQRVAFT